MKIRILITTLFIFLYIEIAIPSTNAATTITANKPLGRLFSTPAERARLDRLRQQNKLNEINTEHTASTIAAPEESVRESLTIDGFVRRSSGKNTTWINQIPQTEQRSTQSIKVKQRLAHEPSVTVSLPTGQRLILKAGQTFDRNTEKIREVYEAAAATTSSKIQGGK